MGTGNEYAMSGKSFVVFVYDICDTQPMHVACIRNILIHDKRSSTKLCVPQGHLGAAVAGSHKGLVNKPIMRVEGACASGGE